jgi:Coenzyme PQQ synthesis protein D (PqqD)
MGSRYLPEPSQRSAKVITCYPVSDGALLFSQPTRRLYRLNTTAAFIWCCCEEGLAPLAIARGLAKRFGISIKLARRDVVRAFSQWKAHGLLATAEYKAVEHQHSRTNEQRREAKNLGVLDPTPVQREHCYRLLDVHLRIRYPCQGTETLVHPILAHLQVHPDDGKNAVVVILDIAEEEGGYVLLKDGTPVSDCVQLLELAPLVQREALLTAYESTDCLVAIHAAAVCNDKKRCVLLPGAGGSGKSTLAAALMRSGFTYLTDELSLLTPDTRLIRPAPVSLSLKRGSWPILAPTYSFLESLPTHLQEGNIEVRYLPPPKDQLLRQETYPVEILVFPKYEVGGSTTLTALGAGEALYRVAEAGYAVPGRLETERVEDLIDWIAQLDCYELQIGDLDKAVCLIKDLLG